jgi:hypothetical protein
VANIIKNGTFENGTTLPDNNFVPTYWQKMKSPYCGGWFTTEQDEGIYMSYSDPSSGTYTGQELISESYPPGLYQGLDLTAYSKDLSIEITFDASADVPYVTTSTETFNVYIYNAIKDNADNYTIVGDYNDYVMRNSFTIDNNYAGYTGNQLPTRKWTSLGCSYALKPGYYVIGFTPETIYNEQAIVKNTYVSFDKVVADVNEISELPYQNILNDSTCDNFVGSGSSWESEGVYRTTVEALDELCPENIRPISGAIYFKPDAVVEDAEAKYYGARQVFATSFFCDAEIRLWHKSTTQADCTFKVYLYKIQRNTDDSYTIIKPAIVNETITTHNNYWDHFNKLVEVGPGEYVIIICPPNETQGTLSNLIVDNITFNIFKSYDTSNKGTYDEPFTLQNGSIVYCGNETYPTIGFRFFDGHITSNEYFVKINNKYYCTNGAIEAGTNHLLCYRSVIVPGPGNLNTARYFDKNGVMAQSTKF